MNPLVALFCLPLWLLRTKLFDVKEDAVLLRDFLDLGSYEIYQFLCLIAYDMVHKIADLRSVWRLAKPQLKLLFRVSSKVFGKPGVELDSFEPLVENKLEKGRVGELDGPVLAVLNKRKIQLAEILSNRYALPIFE